MPHADALALVTGQSLSGPTDENRLAVACYARAMDRVGAMGDDPGFRWLDRVILDLHFDVCQFQRDKRPGRWRTGPIGVTGDDGRLVYRGPDGDQVPTLMAEVADWLQHGDLDAHVAVRAAMAHLNVGHLVQARRRLDQIDLAGERWTALETLAERRGWPGRMVVALEQALIGGADRASYSGEADISSATATNDFRLLLESGWIEQAGRGRSTRYEAAEQLRREIG